MDSGFTHRETTHHRRGQVITTVSRWVAWGMGALSFFLVLDEETRAQPGPALAVLGGYAVFNVAAFLWLRRHPEQRGLKQLHDVADAVAVTTGALISGGLESPIWLLLYPHVVAVSVRGGLAWALSMGLMDALFIGVLTYQTPSQPLGALHAVALLFCAFMGGLTSSHLHSVRQRLSETNVELSQRNRQLQENVTAIEVARTEQQQGLEQLTASEERYRRLLERIQDGVVIIQDGRIVFTNDSFAKMVGSSADELRGRDFRELTPPEDRKDILERYTRWEESQAVAGGFEARLVTRSGEVLLTSVRAGSVEFETRRSVIATIRDITRERRMEQDVHAHAARLAAVNEIANAVNLSLTIEDIFAVAAEEARRLLPFDRLTIALAEEDAGIEIVAVGHGVERHRPPFPPSDVAWAFRRATLWCDGQNTEPPPPQVDGLLAERRVRALLTVPLTSKDRVIGVLNLGRLRPEPFSGSDLALMEPVARHIAIALDNARLLEDVRRRGREFESLLEITRSIVERLEIADILPRVTRAVNELLGTRYCLLLLRQDEELVLGAQEGLEPEVVAVFQGMKVGESLSGWVTAHGEALTVPDMRNDPRLRFADMVERFGYRSYLGVPLRREREVLGTLEVVTKQVRHFTAEEQELMGAFADQAAVAIENARLFDDARRLLAEMAAANERLEELDRLRREYLRNVSHEFRTPLTVIKGYAEFLVDSVDPSLQGMMKIVIESCDRVIDMVDTLIEVSRIEQGAAEKNLQRQNLDMREVVSGALDFIRLTAEKKKVALEADFPKVPLAVQGDQGLLGQVVRKLVDNAVKFSPSGSKVVLRGRPDGDDALVLEVEDFGSGITAEHLPRIFEKFYMGDGGLTRRVGGTGVGLYLVKEIVRLHGGSVDVTSTPGSGSLFTVRLPRETQPARPQARTA